VREELRIGAAGGNCEWLLMIGSHTGSSEAMAETVGGALYQVVACQSENRQCDADSPDVPPFHEEALPYVDAVGDGSEPGEMCEGE